MFDHLETDRKMKVSDACKRAYETALAPHHPFTVRAAAKTAMTFAPNREKLLQNLFSPEVSEEEKYKALKQMVELMSVTKSFLREYYETNNLTGLP